MGHLKEKNNYYETGRAKLFLVVGMVLAMFCSAVIALYLLNNLAALTVCIPMVVFIIGLFINQQIERRKILLDLEKLSQMMIAVAEGCEAQPEIEYKQGQMGLVFTNFQKLSTVLQSTRTVALQDRRFLKDTLSDISHQLKTPLASLKLFIELLNRKGIDEDKKTQLLAEASNQIERMEWLILALLRQARIEAGAVIFEKTACDMQQTLKSAVMAVKHLTEPKNQKVKIELSAKEEGPMLLQCDGPWLIEALVNLLKNASDYTEEGTDILLEAEQNDLFTRISVTDYGQGISEEDMAHIFERFYRGDRSVNPNSVGIGLSLVKSIVEGMGGQITVRSKEGEYTCFKMTFFNLYSVDKMV